jgi:hypothetical protein
MQGRGMVLHAAENGWSAHFGRQPDRDQVRRQDPSLEQGLPSEFGEDPSVVELDLGDRAGEFSGRHLRIGLVPAAQKRRLLVHIVAARDEELADVRL